MSKKQSPIVKQVMQFAREHNTRGSHWARVVRFSPDRLAAIIGRRTDLANALKAVRAHLRAN